MSSYSNSLSVPDQYSEYGMRVPSGYEVLECRRTPGFSAGVGFNIPMFDIYANVWISIGGKETMLLRRRD